MGSLRHLYRWNFVAKQIGWKRAPSIDLPPAASNRAPLVARRHAHRVAFSGAKPGEPYRIYVIPADGGRPEQLSSGENELDPTWSRDGIELMFGVLPTDDPKSAKIMLLDLKTRVLTQIGRASCRERV